MQEELEYVNLKTVVEDYLNTDDYNVYPELDLKIVNCDSLRDLFNNQMFTYKIWPLICSKLDISMDDYEEDPTIINEFAGTHFQLLNWKLSMSRVANSIVVDIYCKELM